MGRTVRRMKAYDRLMRVLDSAIIGAHRRYFGVALLGWAGVVWLVFYEGLFLGIPESCAGLYLAGRVFEPLCASIVAATVFFFITYAIPRQKDWKYAMMYVSKECAHIINATNEVLRRLTGDMEYEVTLEVLYDDEIGARLTAARPLHKTEIQYPGAEVTTWLKYLLDYLVVVNTHATRALVMERHLPAQMACEIGMVQSKPQAHQLDTRESYEWPQQILCTYVKNVIGQVGVLRDTLDESYSEWSVWTRFS